MKSVNMKKKTSTGGYIMLGIIALTLIIIVFFEQYRKTYENKAINVGVQTIATVIDVSREKTEFIKYSYEVNGESYLSSKATPFSGIMPNEKYFIKYLENDPKKNVILFDHPFLNSGVIVQGRVNRVLRNNEAQFSFFYNGQYYKRWQVLQMDHELKTDDLIKIKVNIDNPKIAVIIY